MLTDYRNFSASVLVDLLKKGNVIERCGAICEVVNRRINNIMAMPSDVEKSIEALADDNTVFWDTYTVSDFATAALHLLRDIPYNGSRQEISGLISVKMDFS